MKMINTKNAPAAVGPYSQGVEANGMLFISGQIPFVPETGAVVSEDIKDQTLQSLKNVLAIATEAGYTKENIAKCGVFMKDLSQFALMNEVYAEFFGDHKPARFAVEVSRLPKDVSVEIDAFVVK